MELEDFWVRILLRRRSIDEEALPEGQIVYALKQAELGEKVTEICRKMGVAEATFYNWRKKYKGMGVSELRQMKELEEENGRLKGLVADLSLDKQILQDVLSKKF